MEKKHNGIECRFALPVPIPGETKKSIHIVKEQIHNLDGTITPNLRTVRDYPISFYVTKKGLQNHKSKKEWEPFDNLIKFDCTETELRDRVAAALGRQWSKDHLRKLSNSPYLYGSDISATARIKHAYLTKYPDAVSPFTIAGFDVETDVLYGTNKIIIVSLTFGKECWQGVVRDFVSGITDVEGRAYSALNKYLGEYVAKRDIKATFAVFDSEIEMIKAAFEVIHRWKPDFLEIWNMDFDVQRVMEACERGKVDPKFIFSDPSIPNDLKYFKYKQGKKKKVTVSGVVHPIAPAAQWHTVQTPASYYIIDGMCAYKQVRTGKPEEPSYSLNAILDKTLGIRKLNFKETEHLDGLSWHREMQARYKIEYMIYGLFDTISMLELDEKLGDLRMTLPMFAATSDFWDFSSQTKRLADGLHWHCLEQGYVFGSTGSDMTEVADTETQSLSDWILTLPARNVVDNGLKCIVEDPTLATLIRKDVAD